MKVITIIPTLNEEASIESVVRECKNYGDVLLVDGYSADNTVNLAKNAGAEVIFEKRKGYGRAYLTGFENVDNAEIVVMIDGDGTYPAEKIPLLIEELMKNNYDMILANRFSEDMESGSMPWLNRFGNNLITDVLNRLYGAGIKDSQTGFRVIRKKALNKMSLTQEGMPFATEMIIEASKNNLKIGEITCGYKMRSGDPKLNPVMDGLGIFKTMFWMLRDSNPLRFFGIMGAISILFGLVFGMITAIENYLTGGRVFHTGLALLAALYILIGLQLFIVGIVLDSIKQMLERMKRQVV